MNMPINFNRNDANLLIAEYTVYQLEQKAAYLADRIDKTRDPILRGGLVAAWNREAQMLRTQRDYLARMVASVQKATVDTGQALIDLFNEVAECDDPHCDCHGEE